MKIGEFAKKNNLSTDTIRYYTELGLIVPFKKEFHYFYDKQCEDDISNVLRLKKIGFTLPEIKKFFLYRRMCRMSTTQEKKYFFDLLKEKEKELIFKMEKLQLAFDALQVDIKKIDMHEDSDTKPVGVDISRLSHFVCIHCGKGLKLYAKNIHNNSVLEGDLLCSCGKKIIISDGIIIDEMSSVKESVVPSDLEYVLNNDESFLEQAFRTIKWMDSVICYEELEYLHLMELGVGNGTLLNYVIEKLPETSTYYAIDHDLNILRKAKSIIDKKNKNLNVIFICCDFEYIPINEGVIDYVVDYHGSTNYSHFNQVLPLVKLTHLLTDKATLIGAYAYKDGQRIINGQVNKNNWISKVTIYNMLEQTSFKHIKEIELGLVKNGGAHEPLVTADEELSIYGCYCKRTI